MKEIKETDIYLVEQVYDSETARIIERKRESLEINKRRKKEINQEISQVKKENTLKYLLKNNSLGIFLIFFIALTLVGLIEVIDVQTISILEVIIANIGVSAIATPIYIITHSLIKKTDIKNELDSLRKVVAIYDETIKELSKELEELEKKGNLKIFKRFDRNCNNYNLENNLDIVKECSNLEDYKDDNGQTLKKSIGTRKGIK